MDASSMNPLSTGFAILAGVACILLIPALVMHIRARNFALSVLALELFILNCCNLANVLIWSGNDSSEWWNGSGLCDLEVKLYLGFGQSIIGITASIFRQLAKILDTEHMTLSQSPNRCNCGKIFDISMILGVPGIVMASHYLVQPTRYAISRFSGCQLTWDPSWPSVVLLWIWYPLACSICLFYTFLTVFRLLRHRRQVTTVLHSSPTKTSKSWFIRLLALSTVLVLFFTPFAAYFFIFNVAAGIGSKYSWQGIHPPHWTSHIPMDAESGGIAIDRWAQVFTGIIVALFFGLGKRNITYLVGMISMLLQWSVHLRHRHYDCDGNVAIV